MKSLQQILHNACADRNHPWALATLVKTEGSSYRLPGARLLVSPEGQSIGVLSGGCLEEEIARLGMGVIQSGEPQLHHFDTRKLFGCDGRLWICLERIEAAENTGNFLTQLEARFRSRELCRISVPYTAGEPSSLLSEHALVLEKEGTFTQILPLPTRLLLFGQGPEIESMRTFAHGLGWNVIDYSHPDELPEDFIPDRTTAAVIMNHKFGRDLVSLTRLLPLGLPYVGLLGPKRRQAELLRNFADFHELEPEWLNALHSPAGLDIGSESPEEIAFSIVSEISAVLSSRGAGFLRDRAGAIHPKEAMA